MSTPTLQDGQAGHDAGGSETLGQRLRRAREAQGLKIEAVAEQLRIDVTRLKALECDDFSPFPAAVFVRGYVRGYARLFALPETELIALYERQAAPSAVSLHPLQTTRYDKSEKTILIMRAGCAITLLVLFAGAGFWLMQYTPWRDEPPVMSTVAEAPAREDAAPSAPLPAAATANDSEPLNMKSSPAPASSQQAAAMTEPPGAEAAQNVPPAETSVDALVLRFSAESWLEVWDERGKMLAYELVPGGATRRFEQPRLPFRVRLGNSSAVNIEYNGKVFDQSPYARNSVADFVFDKKIAAALQAREDDIVSVTAE
ncbi:MAG: DUF4115 domain-containing protein [Gammaproteobacteria bacterium]|nr:DUF4115 domain-containing protein [Gammaproteobacteria bacterium]